MKKQLISIITLILVFVMIHYDAHAQVQETTGENIDDSVITQKVKDALTENPLTNKLNIHIETDDGVVQLDGFVDTTEQSGKAGEIAASVQGVQSVKNNLVVKEESVGEYIDDSLIMAKIKAAFALDSAVSVLSIKVNSLNGVVQLSGFVDAAEEARKAEEIAAGIKGVKFVRNDIIVNPVKQEGIGEYIDDSAITVKVKSAFAFDPSVSALDVKVKTFKGVVQLSGFVDTAEQARRASEIAGGIKGVKSVQNNIVVK